MAKKSNINSEVTDFLDGLNHPFKKEIEILRNVVLSADNNLTENIKWNGPNYCVDNEDRITMRIQPTTSKQIQLIFHRGAKKQEQPTDKMIASKSEMLIWKENDRAIASFKNMQEIDNAKAELTEIIKQWISATNKITNR
ncbi:MAG TPA: DUF1801 domain-containing protein [Pelobium sp.]|nr:DUF1801 domain-containing protein [Pelobium sp.]